MTIRQLYSMCTNWTTKTKVEIGYPDGSIATFQNFKALPKDEIDDFYHVSYFHYDEQMNLLTIDLGVA